MEVIIQPFTDGWTPTFSSTRYNGPITINSSTHIQAIAIGFNWTRSKIIDAYYGVTPGTTPAQRSSLVTDGLLRAGTVLRLATSAKVSSKTASTGGKIPLVLDQDLKVGDTVVIPEGTPTRCRPQGCSSLSGILHFGHTCLRGSLSRCDGDIYPPSRR